jgi:hypothetical protein
MRRLRFSERNYVFRLLVAEAQFPQRAGNSTECIAMITTLWVFRFVG